MSVLTVSTYMYYLPTDFKGAEKPDGGPWIAKICLLGVNKMGWGGSSQDPSKTPIGPFYNPKNKNSKSAIENT